MKQNHFSATRPTFYRWKSEAKRGGPPLPTKLPAPLLDPSVPAKIPLSPESSSLPWVKALTTPCCHHFHALPISAPSVPRSRNPSFSFILQPIFVETFWLRAKSLLTKLMVKVPSGLVDRAAIYSHFRKCHSHRLLLNWYPLDLCSTQPIYT